MPKLTNNRKAKTHFNPLKNVKEGHPTRPRRKIDKTLATAIDIARQEARLKKEKRNPPTPLELTNELAQHVAIMWTHNLTDEIIYTSLGIPGKIFYGWLQDNRIVTIQIRMGKDMRYKTLGFKELKEQMKAFFEPSYLMRLEHIVNKSEDAEDFRTASSNLRWLMGKRLPGKYGREADSKIGSDQVETICNAIFNIIFKHIKDPVILGKIQDDLDKMKEEEQIKLQSDIASSGDQTLESDEIDGRGNVRQLHTETETIPEDET
jgi:hypothetical protein